MALDGENQIITSFLERHFGIGYQSGEVTVEEDALVQSVLDFVGQKFNRSRYPMGLALDMALLAQQLSLHDAEAKPFRQELTKETLFARYARITARGETAANTLTLTFGEQEVGIRKLEEAVGDLFVALKRPGYPSAYVYNTGQWHKYQDTLLLPAFRLSESARFKLCRALIEFGLANLPRSHFVGREKPRVRLFEEVIEGYPRSAQKGEKAGSVYQGIAAGYMKADRPHLYLIVDKTRMGSKRQDRIGDIDGYHGLDLEVSVEVKDMPLTGTNVLSEIGEFLSNVVDNRVMGLAFLLSADDEAIETMRGHNTIALTQDELLATVERWDWRKQDMAVHGLIHFLSHVEQNPDAVTRLLEFIKEVDPSHESLAYLHASAAHDSSS